MATVREVLDFIVYLAKIGSGVDNDQMYGFQCADIPAYISYHYFGKWLWGNAIDLLDSAKAQGFEVIYEGDGVIAKAGDIFVMSVPGSPYGHTGIVIEDSDGYTLKTIEQNIDGNWDFLEVGGPARFNTRSYAGMVGYIRFPYGSDTSTPVQREGWIQDSVDGTSRIKMERIHSMLGRISMETGSDSTMTDMLSRIRGSRTMRASGIG